MISSPSNNKTCFNNKTFFNMLHITFFLIGLALTGVLASCGQAPREEGLKRIDVGTAYASQASLKASDYFRKVRYIPLETTEQSLVGNNPEIWIADDHLIVSTEQGCLSFDKESGRFISSIGHKGNDPQGCLSFSGWLNAAAQTIYFPAGNGRSVIYDTEGNFVGEQKDLDQTDGLFGIDSYDYLDAHILVEHLPATATKPDRVILFRDTTLIAAFPSHGEPLFPLAKAMADIEGINVQNDKDTGHNIIYITFKDGQQNGFIPTEQPFWHVKDRLFFREQFNDTLYQVSPEGLSPVSRLDFGTIRWDRKDRFNPEKDKAAYPFAIYENERLLWLRFAVNLYHPEELKFYNAVYDKSRDEVKVSPFKEQVTDDINGFFPLQPTFITPMGEFAQLVSAATLLEWFDTHADNEAWPEEIKNLRKLTEEDNPVVILME